MSMFKFLAELIADRSFYDIEEIASLIQTYFEFYRQDEINTEMSNNDIVKRRNLISAKMRDLGIERSVIEKQLLVAKSRLKEGKEVDTEWMARANLAFRIKKSQIVSLQNDMANLKSYEKEQNIRRHTTLERLINRELFRVLSVEYSKEKAKEIFELAESAVENKVNDEFS